MKLSRNFFRQTIYCIFAHSGSTAFVSDWAGNPVQRVEYLPFGETFIDERTASPGLPYKFNAKELDEETGLYYYGARYYDPNLSLWLSVDPLAEKYPNISSYAYCANNPVKFVDPDGRKIVDASGRLMYANGRWLSNATEGAKLIGNNMMLTPTGRESFTKLANASYGVQLIYDTSSDIGKIGQAEREYNVKTGETTKATITIFEKNLIDELNALNSIQSQGEKVINPTKSQAVMLKMGVPNQAERIGQVGTHEAEHILNPAAQKSNGGSYEAVAVKAEVKAIIETSLRKPLPIPKVEIKILETSLP